MKTINNLNIKFVSIRDKQEVMGTGVTDSSAMIPKRINANMSIELNEKLKGIALELNVNVTEIIRSVLTAFVDSYNGRLK